MNLSSFVLRAVLASLVPASLASWCVSSAYAAEHTKADAVKIPAASLSAALGKRANISEPQAREQIERLFAIVRSELVNGRDVAIEDFGRFAVSERVTKAKQAPNGDAAAPIAKRSLRFIPAKDLREELNKNGAPGGGEKS